MPRSTRNVLLFGASGFIGGHVRAALSPHAVLTCPTSTACDLVRIEPEALTTLLRQVRPDVVVNCAGRTAGSGYDLVHGNTAVTSKLIEAVAAGAPAARLIRIGSAAEYGPVHHGHAVREDDCAVPISDYGVTQLAATRLAELAGRSGRADTVILRVFNPVGHGLPAANALGHAAALLRAALARGDDHLAMGLLDSHRDFVDIRDVAAAVRVAALAGPLPERVFNIGSGRAVTTRHAVHLLAQAAGFRGQIRDGGFSPTTGRSSGVTWMRADITRAGRILGWAPAYDLADSVKALWAGP